MEAITRQSLKGTHGEAFMKAKLQGNNLIIELPLQTPRPSTSGKSMLVGSSYGVRRSAVNERGLVFVRRNVWRGKVGTPKTKRGRGVVPIPLPLMFRL
jgi:hypothetical protein